MDSAEGLSAQEKEAVRQRARELRESARVPGAARRERDRAACAAAIEALEGTDRAVAEMVDEIVAFEAPHLEPRTWYGFPSYAAGKDVVVFVQQASKFGSRYATLGFNESARLDDGAMWATSFAIVEVTEAVREHVRALVHRAAPPPAQ